MIRILSFLILVLSAYTVHALDSQDESYNKGFVSINKIDPSIIIDLKYTANENFLQKPAPGYSSNDAILTTEAAEALSAVQSYLVTRGFSLVVYDAYHPIKTYKIFEKWSEEQDNPTVKEMFYPNITKTALISDGYISNKLEHTRGSTVDVTIIQLNQKVKNPCGKKKLSYQNTGVMIYTDDGTVNMGSSYDVFDPIANPDCEIIDQTAKENRALLKEAMENHGFIANKKVWWQYRLAREPYLDTNFDFDA